jgi:hypothetical protein
MLYAMSWYSMYHLKKSPSRSFVDLLGEGVGMPQKLCNSCHICAFSGSLGNGNVMIFSTVPGRDWGFR